MAKQRIKFYDSILECEAAKDGAIRWAIGSVDGLRSSTWRLWGNKKGDIYVSSRSLGSKIKASLHKDRNCHVGFTTEYADKAREKFSDVGSRHWQKWRLQDGPLVQALQIVFPVSELRAFRSTESLSKVCWIPMPAVNFVSVVTIYIAKNGIRIKWPEASQGFRPFAVISTEAHIAVAIYSTNFVDDKTKLFIEEQRTQVKSRFGREEAKPGMRAMLLGDIDQNSKFFLELALD